MKIWQEGIEPLENPQEPVEGEKEHYCFDDYRISLKYNYNEKDGVSGVGILSYAPGGLIWCQTGYYCLELDEFASYYYAIQDVLEEAKKSKAKNLTLYFDNKKFVEMINLKEKPYKLDVHNKIHDSIISMLNEFSSNKIIFRDKYPNNITDRLKKEAEEVSQAPEFDMRGRWQNSPNTSYYNIKTQTEEQKRSYIEQFVHIFYDSHKSYMKEYEQDYGEETLKKMIQDVSSGKVKKLPDVKRVKANKVRYLKVKNPHKLKKDPICQNCGEVMVIEDCLKKFPEKQVIYYLRCKKCKASKDVLENGRVLVFRKYPNKK